MAVVKPKGGCRVSRELFESQIKVLALRVEQEAQKRHPEAQTAYEIHGSNVQMKCIFRIRAKHGEDTIEITYSNGNIDFIVVW